MKREVFLLAIVTACVAYLSYFVATRGPGYFGGVSAGLLAVYVINEWSRVFSELGRLSARTRPRGEGDR
jgi:hypothetical protein